MCFAAANTLRRDGKGKLEAVCCGGCVIDDAGEATSLHCPYMPTPIVSQRI